MPLEMHVNFFISYPIAEILELHLIADFRCYVFFGADLTKLLDFGTLSLFVHMAVDLWYCFI